MKLATLCSGIGAPEVAAKRLGWECLWSAEVDPQASAVLAHHHPESVNLGDITKIDGGELERPDVLVFGTPCQSFSVAGRRAGMDDPRGVLAFVALGIVGRVRPTWFVLENVPGLLSSSKGRDFGAFLRAVDALGYSGAWASPDAQFFGLAQRRERVFFVGHIGDWRYPAAVLSQFSRLCGHPAPSREKGEVASTLFASGAGTSRPAGCASEPGFRIPVGISDISHTLTKRYDSSEDGCGRGVPLVMAHGQGGAEKWPADVAPTLNAHFGDKQGLEDQHALNGAGLFVPSPIVFDPNQVTSPGNYSNPKAGDPCHPLVSAAPPLMAFTQNQVGDVLCGPVCPSMGTNQNATGRNTPKVAQPLRGNIYNNSDPRMEAQMHAYQGMSVRRLTPRECERLQGFEDDYTLIPYGKKGKPMADGPRYKMIGNSMALKVLVWLLAKIEATA